jgi:MOSC domain-containing protein YiiM
MWSSYALRAMRQCRWNRYWKSKRSPGTTWKAIDTLMGQDIGSKLRVRAAKVTLIELKSIELLKREKSIAIEPEASRQNVVTRSVPLNHLVGREFQVGAVLLRGMRLCEPCAYLEGLTQQGVLAGLIHRGGLRAEIVTGGTIRVEDAFTEWKITRKAIDAGEALL